jgi:hypothetical protein
LLGALRLEAVGQLGAALREQAEAAGDGAVAARVGGGRLSVGDDRSVGQRLLPDLPFLAESPSRERTTTFSDVWPCLSVGPFRLASTPDGRPPGAFVGGGRTDNGPLPRDP